MKNRWIWSMLLVAAMLTGCASAPSQYDIATANYGAPIASWEAEKKATEFFSLYLKDPYSAQYQFSTVNRGYYVGNAFESRELTAGYMLIASVNAKNSYGGYTGAVEYRLIFHDGKLVRVIEVMPQGTLKKIL